MSETAAGAPRKIICLETYWSDHKGRLFQNTSVRPFLEALAAHFDPPLQIAHRYVESMAKLSYYVNWPDGLFWHDRDVFDAPVFYLSFHGAPGTLLSALERVEAGALCKAFEGWGDKYANLVHFGACSVFGGEAGQDFARDFLAASRCRAVSGYTSDVDWIDSMMTDMLFLRRFFNDPDPWTNIRSLHESVLADFAPAQRLGYQLHARAL